MALLFCDGFDHYDTAHRMQKWDYFVDFWNIVSIVQGPGRFGGGAMQFQNQYETAQKIIPVSTTIIMGAAINPASNFLSWGGWLMESYNSGGAKTAGIVVTTSGVLQLYINGAWVASSQIPFRNGVYQYVEWKLVCNATTGSSIVKINETEVINVTGKNTGTDCAKIGIGVDNGGWVRTEMTVYFDDLYICNDSGSDCNDFLGDIRVEEKLPTGDGYYTEWNTTGGNHYGEVDDAPDALDTDTKVAAQVVDKRDTYTFSDLTAGGGDVYAVVMNYYMSKADSGARKIKALARLSGTDGLGSEISVGVGYAFYQSVMYKDPANNAWTVANVNAAEFGQKVTA